MTFVLNDINDVKHDVINMNHCVISNVAAWETLRAIKGKNSFEVEFPFLGTIFRSRYSSGEFAKDVEIAMSNAIFDAAIELIQTSMRLALSMITYSTIYVVKKVMLSQRNERMYLL